MNKDQLPSVIPTKGKPLHGADARQVATWLERYASRLPAVRLAPRATCWLRSVRRGREPLRAGRFHAILSYVQRRKRELTPARLSLSLTPGTLDINWGVSQNQKGREGVGPGIPPPLVSPRNFRY